MEAFWLWIRACTDPYGSRNQLIPHLHRLASTRLEEPSLSGVGATAWLAQLGPHTGYAAGVLGPLILAGIGLGMVIAPAINTGTFGVAPQDAGVASATVTVGQMLRGPDHRPPGADRAGAGTRLRHRVLVDRRHLRRGRGRRRRPAPPRAAGPEAHAAPG